MKLNDTHGVSPPSGHAVSPSHPDAPERSKQKEAK
jgi:hypothetical protein